MNIRIFHRIDDPFLKSEWERLEVEADVFPQSTYHWCSTWWKHLSGRRKLHVVMVIDEEGKALGIAPLCIERQFGIRVLRSFPIHFGDFYTFIFAKGISSKAVLDTLFNYLANTQGNKWRWLRIDQLSEENCILLTTLEERNWLSKEVTRCPTSMFPGLEWDEYLAMLSSSFRATVRRRIRKFSGKFESKFLCIKSWEQFSPFFAEMLDIHAGRWHDDWVPEKGEIEKVTWELAIKGAFESERAVFFALLANNEIVAYRLGFFHENVYYDWHLSHNYKYAADSPGIVIVANVIQYLLKNSYDGINFMCGNYDWKLHWCPAKKAAINYMFSSPSSNLAAAFLNCYHHRIRDKLKGGYHKMLDYSIVRTISRNTLLLRRKLSGKQ
jgi:hypothetical protein